MPVLRAADDHIREGGHVNQARFPWNMAIWAHISRRAIVFLVAANTHFSVFKVYP